MNIAWYSNPRHSFSWTKATKTQSVCAQQSISPWAKFDTFFHSRKLKWKIILKKANKNRQFQLKITFDCATATTLGCFLIFVWLLSTFDTRCFAFKRKLPFSLKIPHFFPLSGWIFWSLPVVRCDFNLHAITAACNVIHV